MRWRKPSRTFASMSATVCAEHEASSVSWLLLGKHGSSVNSQRESVTNDAGTAGGHQLVTCPLAKGTLLTYPLDSIFDDLLVQFSCSRSF